MNYGKRALILTIAIGAFLFFYLRTVKNEREKGIEQFLKHPEIGDIYKIRYEDEDGNKTVRYYKVAEVHDNFISFFPGKISAWNLSDVLLDEYDTTITKDFTPEELIQLSKGQLSKYRMREAELVEIQRKSNRIPANSI
ncbi:MAG: hypothetical protein C5B52_14170 [Bacteroidetes bacterium]|nr:MAG: hypothetical protein C5B52_14170 [Bacteroidota bacterium]